MTACRRRATPRPGTAGGSEPRAAGTRRSRDTGRRRAHRPRHMAGMETAGLQDRQVPAVERTGGVRVDRPPGRVTREWTPRPPRRGSIHVAPVAGSPRSAGKAAMHARAIAVATRRMIVPAAVAFLVAWWPCGAAAAAGWPPPASGGGARGRAGWPGRCVNMALCCGQARRRAAFPVRRARAGPGACRASRSGSCRRRSSARLSPSGWAPAPGFTAAQGWRHSRGRPCAAACARARTNCS